MNERRRLAERLSIKAVVMSSAYIEAAASPRSPQELGGIPYLYLKEDSTALLKFLKDGASIASVAKEADYAMANFLIKSEIAGQTDNGTYQRLHQIFKGLSGLYDDDRLFPSQKKAAQSAHQQSMKNVTMIAQP